MERRHTTQQGLIKTIGLTRSNCSNLRHFGAFVHPSATWASLRCHGAAHELHRRFLLHRSTPFTLASQAKSKSRPRLVQNWVQKSYITHSAGVLSNLWRSLHAVVTDHGFEKHNYPSATTLSPTFSFGSLSSFSPTIQPTSIASASTNS